MFLEALISIQRNFGSFLLYAGVLAPVNCVAIFVSRLYAGTNVGQPPSPWLSLAGFGTDLAVAAAYGVAQSIVFSRLGRDIDRPLWKIPDDREAFRRFFLMWFAFGLVNHLIPRLTDIAYLQFDNKPLASGLFNVYVLFAVCYVPLGAVVMFNGRVGRHEFLRGMNTLFLQMPRTMLVLLCNLVVFFLLTSILWIENLSDAVLPLLLVVDVFTECFIFSCVWIICMYHRDQDLEDEDLDL